MLIMSQVKDDSILVMFRITIWNQEFFEGFIIIGPLFSICVYNATINGQITWGKKNAGYTNYALSKRFSRCKSDSNGVSASPAMSHHCIALSSDQPH